MPNRRQGSQVDSAAAGCRPDGPFGRHWAVRGDSSGAVYFGVGVTGEFGVFARAGDSDEHRIRRVVRAERAAADETGHVVRGRSAMPPIRRAARDVLASLRCGFLRCPRSSTGRAADQRAALANPSSARLKTSREQDNPRDPLRCRESRGSGCGPATECLPRNLSQRTADQTTETAVACGPLLPWVTV